MVYVTGDTHGDLTRIKNFIVRFNCTSDDIIVILGDVGINYYGSNQETKAKFRYNNYGPTIFCIQGNHEERPFNISTYKEKEWHGGIVYYEEEFPNIIFAKDGEIYDIDNKKCLVLGGAYSVDKWYRIMRTYVKYQFTLPEMLTQEEYEYALMFIQGQYKDNDFVIRNKLEKIYKSFPKGICSWFQDEQPNDEIKQYVAQKLLNNPDVDVVFSHTCPSKYIPTEMFLSSINQSTVDNSTEDWLNEIENNLHYNKWYCGHWHTNKKIDKMIFLFEDFVEL